MTDEKDGGARADAGAPGNGAGVQTTPDGDTWPAGMKIVRPHLARSIRAQGMIQEPNTYGYLHLAGEVEGMNPLRKPSPEKRALLDRLKELARALMEAERGAVRRADVFRGLFTPTGHNPGLTLIREGGYDVHVAKFDVVVLVECESHEEAVRVRETDAFKALRAELERTASYVHCFAALNAKRIAEVDKTRDGIFLFNYFFAADIEAKGSEGVDILRAVWEYTAGWWTAKVNLTNSTLLEPLPGEPSQYSLINHCRWDRGLDVFPNLILRPSLQRFVVANFTANDVASMPVVYRLA